MLDTYEVRSRRNKKPWSNWRPWQYPIDGITQLFEADWDTVTLKEKTDAYGVLRVQYRKAPRKDSDGAPPHRVC